MLCLTYFVSFCDTSFRFVSLYFVSFSFLSLVVPRKWKETNKKTKQNKEIQKNDNSIFKFFNYNPSCMSVRYSTPHVHYPQLNSSRVCLPTNFQKFKCHIFICVCVCVSIYEL
jgi:hypothetical protein